LSTRIIDVAYGENVLLIKQYILVLFSWHLYIGLVNTDNNRLSFDHNCQGHCLE